MPLHESIKNARSMTYNRQQDVRLLVQAIRDEFLRNFDTVWFGIIARNLPFDGKKVREIRQLFHKDGQTGYSADQTREIIERLSHFIQSARLFLLPSLKEKMGVSGLDPAQKEMDRDQYLIRSLIIYTLPYNLDRLNRLVCELEGCLEDTVKKRA
jgi:hypothetical protein